MTTVNRHQFRKVFNHFLAVDENSSKDERISYEQLRAIVNCCGKNVIGRGMESMWPAAQEAINLDQAYSIFLRYDSPEVSLKPEELTKFDHFKIQDIVSVIQNKYPSFEDEAIETLIECRNENGNMDLGQFLHDVEERRLEVLELVKQKNDRRQSSQSMSVKIDHTIKYPNLLGFFVVSPELMVIQYTLDFDTPSNCEVVLKLGVNSDVSMKNGHHPFENDVVALVIDSNEHLISVTHKLTDEGYSTGTFQQNSNCTIMVVCLGTCSLAQSNVSSKIELLSTTGKITKQFKVVLMNIFDMFDLDCNGLLSKAEYDLYAIASGDRETTDEEWASLSEQFEFRENELTMGGFVDIHQCELDVGDENSIDDMWTSLNYIGYNSQLKLTNACPFSLEIKCDALRNAEAELIKMTKEDSQTVLRYFYNIGTPLDSCELYSRIYRTEYFGIVVVDKAQIVDNSTYQINILEDENVKWNFINGKTNIQPSASETNWIFILAYAASAKEHKANFVLEKE